MSKDEKIIGQLLNDIEKSLTWGPSSQWTNKEYKDLSKLVFDKTKVTLSHTTLKRIWGHLLN